jgi:hypothetical protein
VPRTGVIYVSSEAARRGFTDEPHRWANLGQGQPETGPLPDGAARLQSIPVAVDDQEYAPVGGLLELREAVADLYNQRYRRGRGSKYTADHVAIGGGGRASLTRVVSALGSVNLGHFLPDYTAYEELLDLFRTFTSIPILLDPESGYDFDATALAREVQGRGLGALLLSNPGNPTGKVVGGDRLASWVDVTRQLDCALICDEFYSHYVWGGELGRTNSAAAYVDDVDEDPVVILDGLTKNWRYPGWRVTWTLGPRAVIDAVTSAGSFLDGGGNRPLQRAAIPLLDPAVADAEARAIQAAFEAKRAVALDGVRKLGLHVDAAPEGTFYVWARIDDRVPGDGMAWFQRALDRRVIVVPGEFFDINPGQRRPGHASRFDRHLRFSFGPPLSVLTEGFARLSDLSV